MSQFLLHYCFSDFGKRQNLIFQNRTHVIAENPQHRPTAAKKVEHLSSEVSEEFMLLSHSSI